MTGERHLSVLHTVRSLRLDGVTKVVLRVVAHGQSPDIRHHVCSMRPEAALLDECRAAGVEPHFVGYHGVASAPRTVARLVRLIRDLGIDVVHANRTLDVALAGAAARICGVPMIATLHWLGRVEDHPEDGDPRSVRRQAEMRAPAMLHRLLTDRIVAVSEAVRASFARIPGFPDDRVTVVYPGQDTTPVAAEAERAARLRSVFGISRARPVLLNVGRLQPVKGQMHLVPMMQRVVRHVPDALLLIAGEGELRAPLTRAIEAAGLTNSIRLLGARSDVDDLLALCTLLVLVSESEAAPLPLFEAMRASRPVIATNVGGVPEIVADGTSGLLVPRGDPTAMADAAVRLLTSPAEAERMGAAGRAILLEKFDIHHAVAVLEGLYREVVHTRRGDRPLSVSPRTRRRDAARRPST